LAKSTYYEAPRYAASRYFLSLMSKYSPQHPILKDPQSFSWGETANFATRRTDVQQSYYVSRLCVLSVLNTTTYSVTVMF